MSLTCLTYLRQDQTSHKKNKQAGQIELKAVLN